MAPPSPSLYDRIGPEALRAVVADFYARVFADVMIGFLFVGKDERRLVDKEVELAARFLGGDVAYTGKPLRAAHAPLRILGGQFDRRLQILRSTLADHGVDPAVQEAWIGHTVALRSQITGDVGSDCDHDIAAERAAAAGATLPDAPEVIGIRRRPRP
jgi:hemoglobin